MINTKISVDFDTRSFDKLEGGVDRALGMMVEAAAKDMTAGLMRRTPIKTGRARSGWEVSYSGGTTARIENTVEYVGYLDKGTKPHVIRPKTKKALAFNGIVRKSVNHPGTKALNIVQNTIDQDLPKAIDAAQRSLQAYLAATG